MLNTPKRVIIYVYCDYTKEGLVYKNNSNDVITDAIDKLIERAKENGYIPIVDKTTLYSYQLNGFNPTSDDVVVLVNTKDRYDYQPKIGFKMFEVSTAEEIDKLFT